MSIFISTEKRKFFLHWNFSKNFFKKCYIKHDLKTFFCVFHFSFIKKKNSAKFERTKIASNKFFNEKLSEHIFWWEWWKHNITFLMVKIIMKTGKILSSSIIFIQVKTNTTISNKEFSIKINKWNYYSFSYLALY